MRESGIRHSFSNEMGCKVKSILHFRFRKIRVMGSAEFSDRIIYRRNIK